MEENKDILNNSKENSSSLKKNHTAIIALIILVLMVALGFRGYYFFKKIQVSNPVTITTNKIADLANEYTKVLEDSDFYSKDKTTKITLNGKVGEYELNIDGGFDLKNNIVKYLVSFSESKNSLLYLDGSFAKDNMQIQIAKDSNKYVAINDFSEVFKYFEDYSKSMNNNYSDKITKYFAESFEENFTKDDFTKSKDEITVFDKEMNVTKYETTFNEKDIAKVLKTFIDKLSSDADFIDMILNVAKTTGEELSKDDIKASFVELKESLNEELPQINIKYSIYVKGLDTVRFAFDIKDADLKMNIDTYKNDSRIYVDTPSAKISLDYNKKSNEYSISMNKVTFVSGTYKETIKKNDVSVDITFNIPLLAIDGELNSRLFIDDDLKVDDYKDALDISKQENAEKFMNELQSNEFLMGLVEGLEGMLQGGSTWTSVDGIDI